MRADAPVELLEHGAGALDAVAACVSCCLIRRTSSILPLLLLRGCFLRAFVWSLSASDVKAITAARQAPTTRTQAGAASNPNTV